MIFSRQPLYAVLVLFVVCSAGAYAQQSSTVQVKTLGTVTVTAGRTTSLPIETPATIEGVTGKQVEDTVNATDSEDALKYLPSLLVRKRYPGDYDHAVLASRASGSGNSARSLVYADGILLSNLLGNGATFTPRWGLVTPEEIERVDVLYGPFSAAYSGNSVGAVVDYQTRMPTKFEGHAKLSVFSQGFKQYSSDETYAGRQVSASLGDRNGSWSWWLNVNRLDSEGQPLVFPNRPTSAGTPGTGGTPVTGAVADRNPKNQDWWILGASNQVRTIQDHAKAKLVYDFSPTLRAGYTLGWWRNDARRSSGSYLRDGVGAPVYSGDVNIDGRRYALTPADFAPSRGNLEHVMHGLSLKSNTGGTWDWEVAASRYDYARDQVRTAQSALPAADTGGAGSIADMKGTGWNTVSLRGTWRPQTGVHTVGFGYQRERYALRTLVSNTPEWRDGNAMSRVSAFNGNSMLESLFLQDTWQFAPAWRATLGGRLETWRAFGGELANASTKLPFGSRKETYFSPKAAISYRISPELTLKSSIGRAVRMPTVAELYQGTISSTTIVNNDPNLRPEQSWTGEWTVERDLGNGLLRATLFRENTLDALYSQTNVTVTPNVTNIQNVDEIRTTGIELAWQAFDLAVRGFDLTSSLTYADSRIERNAKFPNSVGMRQPRVPDWRANILASYRASDRWTHTLGLRYSGRQYNTLDNSDQNAFTYTGTSNFLVADVRTRYRASGWSLALGIDNLGDDKYWAFHRYPGRTFVAELRLDI